MTSEAIGLINWRSCAIKLSGKEQIRALLLVQIGNVLEHFDLMLYIHSALLLNAFFFPKTDLRSEFLLATLGFSSVYLLRPLGSLCFGYLGDNYGRKVVVTLTTSLMACCAFTIATLPGYQQIGNTASVIVVICRLLQGFSAAGEVTGAKVYLYEMAAPPKSYFYTALVTVSSALGGFTSLLVTCYFMRLYPKEGWRYAFLLGSVIAVIGLLARNYLKETPDFLLAKFDPSIRDKIKKQTASLFWKKLVNPYFLCCSVANCLGPLGFFIFYIYCGHILKTCYQLTINQIMQHNLLLAGAFLLSTYLFSLLTLKVHPLKIALTRCTLLLCLLPALPFLLNQATLSQFFTIQLCYGILCEGSFPAHALFIKSFSPLRRMTSSAFALSLSQIIVCLLTTYGCWWVDQLWGYRGITGLLILVTLITLGALLRFFQLISPICQPITENVSSTLQRVFRG